MTTLIDESALRESVANDREVLVDLAQVFADATPAGLQWLRRATAEGDTESVQNLAKQLQRRFKFFACEGLAEVAEELRQLAADEQLSGADELVQSLAEGTVQLVEELRTLTGEDLPKPPIS